MSTLYPKISCKGPHWLVSENGLLCNTCCCVEYPVYVFLMRLDAFSGGKWTAEGEAYDSCGKLVCSKLWEDLVTPPEGWALGCGANEMWVLMSSQDAPITLVHREPPIEAFTIGPADLSCNPACITCYCTLYPPPF